MHKYILQIILLLLWIAGATAHAGSLPVQIDAALENFANDNGTHWAYTRETLEDGERYTERFDPALPRLQQWRLLSHEGGAPSKKAIKRYQKHYEDLFERDAPTQFDIDTLMDPDTITLSRETDSVLEYTFTPLAEDEEDAKIVPYLRGTITIDKQRQQVMAVHLVNTQKFSPVAMVSIKKLKLSLEFAQLAEHGPVVVVSLRSSTEGRFMGLKKLSESEEVSFRDFELRSGSAPESAGVGAE